MTQHFTATLTIQNRDGETPDEQHLKYALTELLRRSCKFPPDRRFDWSKARVIVEPPIP